VQWLPQSSYRTNLFSGLRAELSRDLFAKARMLSLKADQMVFLAGDAGDGCYRIRAIPAIAPRSADQRQWTIREGCEKRLQICCASRSQSASSDKFQSSEFSRTISQISMICEIRAGIPLTAVRATGT
jgi:hypothetical protein